MTIQESNLSFRSEYEIETAGCFYHAKKAFFSFPAKLTVQSPSEQIVARIEGRFSFLREKYDFILTDSGVFHFWCEKRWKRVFECDGDGASYKIYGHKGLKYSIFQNDEQIAAFIKNRVVFGRGNRYEVQLNDDANVILIICMILGICTSEDDDNDATVTVDLGSIGPEEKPFDERWQPS